MSVPLQNSFLHQAMTNSARTCLLIFTGLLIIIILLARPIDDVDIFTQIRLGQLILQNGTIWTLDHFSFLNEGKLLPSIGWLAQVLFACVYNNAGWLGIKILCSALYAAAFIVNGSTVTKNVRGFALIAGIMIGALVAESLCNLRPQAIAAISCAAIAVLLHRNMNVLIKFLLWFIICCIWQNAHPSLVIALVLVGIWFISDVTLHTRKGLILFISLFAFTGFIQLLTPDGIHIFELGKLNFFLSRTTLHSSEWMPAFDSSVIEASTPFLVSLVLSCVLLFQVRKYAHREDIISFLCFASISLFSARFILFYSIIMVPIWSRWIEAALPKDFFSWDLKKIGIRHIATGIVLLSGIHFFINLYKLPEEIPYRGIAALKEKLKEGRIYNYREWGGPLILEGLPNWRIFIDGRLYLYSLDDWREYSKGAQGKIPVSELIERYHLNAFFLNPEFHKELIEKLRKSAQVQEISADSLSVVFVVL